MCKLWQVFVSAFHSLTLEPAFLIYSIGKGIDGIVSYELYIQKVMVLVKCAFVGISLYFVKLYLGVQGQFELHFGNV